MSCFFNPSLILGNVRRQEGLDKGAIPFLVAILFLVRGSLLASRLQPKLLQWNATVDTLAVKWGRHWRSSTRPCCLQTTIAMLGYYQMFARTPRYLHSSTIALWAISVLAALVKMITMLCSDMCEGAETNACAWWLMMRNLMICHVITWSKIVKLAHF